MKTLRGSQNPQAHIVCIAIFFFLSTSLSNYYTHIWILLDCICMQYACRKTLADSRPRVKGRFARNSTTGDAADGSQSTGLAEVVSSPLATTNAMCNDDDDGGSGDLPEWWPAMKEALARQEDDDEDLLAAYLGVSSINLYSPRGHSS